MIFSRLKNSLPTPDEALPGRPARPFTLSERHAVLGTPLEGDLAPGLDVVSFGLGCFWGAEGIFWQTEGVVSTAVGYQGGSTPHPTYEEVCSGRTGHTEAVRVVFDPTKVSFSDLLRVFWEAHDPTQGNRQGNDVGTQYRSAVYYRGEEQRKLVEESRAAYADVLARAGFGAITTETREVGDAGPFYYAEDYHQQYLHKVPWGYCGIGGTGVPMCAPNAERPAAK
ncbi:MAG: peptide-methionine (S)-S-oxide reductase MsrA [Actinomycetota bacterium]|nr:peptide-methionine (S)-S-oxide reductase MsrA [Actinomycetota bacterium]